MDAVVVVVCIDVVDMNAVVSISGVEIKVVVCIDCVDMNEVVCISGVEM